MRATAVFLTCFVCGVLVLVVGCPSGSTGPDGSADVGDNSNGTTPQPPAAFLPTAITLDISELPEDSDSDTSEVRDSAQLQPNIYDSVTRASATIVYRFHRLADRALALGAAIRDDMTDPNQTQVAGTFQVGALEVSYKADFAAFDIDGDGTPDGSGNAADVPVAVRMWVDRGTGFERFLCARITQRPSSENIGSGQLFVRPDAADAAAPEEAQFFVDYDRTQADHKWNLAYVTGRMHPRYEVTIGMARVDVRTEAGGGTEKTVRAAYDLAESPYGLETFQSAAHYLLGGDGLLLSAATTRGSAEANFTNVCVSLANRRRARGGECDTFDTQDMNLLDIPLGGEVEFPADFPAAPTF